MISSRIKLSKDYAESWFVGLILFGMVALNNFSVMFWNGAGKSLFFSFLILLIVYAIRFSKVMVKQCNWLTLVLAILLLATSISTSPSQTVQNFFFVFLIPIMMASVSAGKPNSFVVFSKIFLYLLVVGFVFYVISFIVDSMPLYIIEKPHDSRIWFCHMLSCRNDFSSRYMFIFEEPGTLAGISALLLTLKVYGGKESWALIIVSMFTFSMFFYVFLIIYLFFGLRGKTRIIALLFLLSGYMIAVPFLQSLDNEFMNYNILRRLIISGNFVVGVVDNRTGEEFSIFYENINIFNKLFGVHVPMDEIYFGWTGMTYRTFVLENGFILMLSLSVVIYLMAYSAKGLYFSIFFLAFFLAFFYQRPLFFRPEYLGIFLAWVYCQKRLGTIRLPSSVVATPLNFHIKARPTRGE